MDDLCTPPPSTASLLFDPRPVSTHQPPSALFHPPPPWHQKKGLPLNTVQSGSGPAGIVPYVRFHILSSPALCFLSRSHTSATAGPAPGPAQILSASQHDYKATA
ncbi:hypothetical protein NQZ68_023762 [Dissostichus eleginoides]|nr:hypothetical protein NQZ68_023762 [Dissostichus eleginoides]